VEEILRAKFSERGIFRTKVGRDIIFRKGDPCSARDLVKAAAHQATAILLMMTEKDQAEAEESRGGADDLPSVENAATIRCLLALRNVIYSNGTADGGEEEVRRRFNPNLRVVVQLHVPCSFMEAAASFLDPEGRNVVYLQDLTLELNTIVSASKKERKKERKEREEMPASILLLATFLVRRTHIHTLRKC